MADTSINKESLFRAVLAMDLYHRGYNAGVFNDPRVAADRILEGDLPATIGLATVGRTSDQSNLIGLIADKADQKIGFYAVEYTYQGKTIIGYRGTDDGFQPLLGGDDRNPGAGVGYDTFNGFGIGTAGLPDIPQARAAIEFYKSVAGGALQATDIEVLGQTYTGTATINGAAL